MIYIKRAYDPPAAEDGARYLVERLWPRGVSKEEAHLDGWIKDVAPSTELRKWYGHDTARWSEFERRYEEELKQPEARGALQSLAEKARQGDLTLVVGTKDVEHSGAAVLKQVLERMLG